MVEATMERPVIGVQMELLPVRDVADELGISVMTAYRRIWDGSLKAYRLGPHSTVVSRADLERFKADIGT